MTGRIAVMQLNRSKCRIAINRQWDAARFRIGFIGRCRRIKARHLFAGFTPLNGAAQPRTGRFVCE